VLLVVTAGVFEELAFRGYALERLSELTGRRWLAALASWAAFTLCHGPSFGFAHLLPVAFVGALVTALYLWQRDLVVNIVAHAAFDGIGLLLVPALLPAR
jgi:membrane protease YdiL (CAAX protease family)